MIETDEKHHTVRTLMASVTRLPSQRGSFWFICCETISVSQERTSVATRRNASR
jgi:hypothetical protein